MARSTSKKESSLAAIAQSLFPDYQHMSRLLQKLTDDPLLPAVAMLLPHAYNHPLPVVRYELAEPNSPAGISTRLNVLLDNMSGERPHYYRYTNLTTYEISRASAGDSSYVVSHISDPDDLGFSGTKLTDIQEFADHRLIEQIGPNYAAKYAEALWLLATANDRDDRIQFEIDGVVDGGVIEKSVETWRRYNKFATAADALYPGFSEMSELIIKTRQEDTLLAAINAQHDDRGLLRAELGLTAHAVGKPCTLTINFGSLSNPPSVECITLTPKNGRLVLSRSPHNISPYLSENIPATPSALLKFTHTALLAYAGPAAAMRYLELERMHQTSRGKSTEWEKLLRAKVKELKTVQERIRLEKISPGPNFSVLGPCL